MISDFGVHELQRYISAEYELRRLEATRDYERESVLCSLFPSLDVSEGKHKYLRYSTENAAIRLVEIDEALKGAAAVFIKKRTILNKAMQTLTDNETHAFNVMVWGDVSDTPVNVLEGYARRATEKLCEFIAKHQEQHEKEWQQQLKADRIRKAKEWKRGIS